MKVLWNAKKTIPLIIFFKARWSSNCLGDENELYGICTYSTIQ
jgi:hypothetical protein